MCKKKRLILAHQSKPLLQPSKNKVEKVKQDLKCLKRHVLKVDAIRSLQRKSNHIVLVFRLKLILTQSVLAIVGNQISAFFCAWNADLLIDNWLVSINDQQSGQNIKFNCSNIIILMTLIVSCCCQFIGKLLYYNLAK